MYTCTRIAPNFPAKWSMCGERQVDSRPDPRPERTPGGRDRRQQRPWPRDGTGAGAQGRARGARVSQHGQGRRGQALDRGRRPERGARRGAARPREPRLGALVCRAHARRPRRARPADQQRRRDGHPAAPDGRRLRASVRHEPPRPLRPHRVADRQARGTRGVARGHDVEHHAQGRAHRLRQPRRRAALLPLARLWTVEARQPALRARARSPPARGGVGDQEPGRPSRLRRPPISSTRGRASSTSC